jgi:hypothetical protein
MTYTVQQKIHTLVKYNLYISFLDNLNSDLATRLLVQPLEGKQRGKHILRSESTMSCGGGGRGGGRGGRGGGRGGRGGGYGGHVDHESAKTDGKKNAIPETNK